MPFLVTCIVVCGAAGLGNGCVTEQLEFEPEQNFPPSVVSQPDAIHPLREIADINLSDELPPGEPEEVPLQVIIRDPNFDQTLQYRMFLDATPTSDPFPFDQDIIEPSGDLERERTFSVPYSILTPGVCHEVELVVVGEFASLVELRRPVEEGDFDEANWWLRVVDDDSPEIEQDCQ